MKLRTDRKPIMPKRFYRTIDGVCRFCGKEVSSGVWHSSCKLEWERIKSPKKMREYVYLRDKGTCRICGGR